MFKKKMRKNITSPHKDPPPSNNKNKTNRNKTNKQINKQKTSWMTRKRKKGGGVRTD